MFSLVRGSQQIKSHALHSIWFTIMRYLSSLFSFHKHKTFRAFWHRPLAIRMTTHWLGKKWETRTCRSIDLNIPQII
jgi:hypothetical protein